MPRAQLNRARGLLDSQGFLDPNLFNEESFRAEYDGSGNAIYLGYAKPGAAEGQLVWQISKQTYDGSDNLTEIKWPALTMTLPNTSSTQVTSIASNDYLFSWTDRATYTYF